MKSEKFNRPKYGNEIIMVDCGMAFPDDDMPGVDMVINDITYLEKNWSKIKGIFSYSRSRGTISADCLIS